MKQEKIIYYSSRERNDDTLLGMWGRLERIDDLWAMVGYYANESNTQLSVKRLEWFNPMYIGNVEYFKKWLKSQIESKEPIAVLTIDGRDVYFYVNEEAFENE